MRTCGSGCLDRALGKEQERRWCLEVEGLEGRARPELLTVGAGSFFVVGCLSCVIGR